MTNLILQEKLNQVNSKILKKEFSNEKEELILLREYRFLFNQLNKG